MELSVGKADLQKELQLCQGVVEKRSTIPILSNVLLKAADGLRNIDRVIPGHNPVMRPADLREYAQFNKDFLAFVQAGLRANKSVDEMAASYKLDETKYKGYTIAEARLKSNIQVIVNELK